jgi:hypothetical protein
VMLLSIEHPCEKSEDRYDGFHFTRCNCYLVWDLSNYLGRGQYLRAVEHSNLSKIIEGNISTAI